MKLRLKCNKTSMYQLCMLFYENIPEDVKSETYVPLLKECEFTKMPRCRDYRLEFTVNEYYCKYYLCVCLGKPALRMQVFRFEESVFDKVYPVPYVLLNNFHLLEVLPDKDQEVTFL